MKGMHDAYVHKRQQGENFNMNMGRFQYWHKRSLKKFEVQIYTKNTLY